MEKSISVRTTWNFQFTPDEGEWPDMTDYAGRPFQPRAVNVQVIRQPAHIDPACTPEIYHISASGPRILASGKLSDVSWLEHAWAWRMALELPEDGGRAPGWLIELGREALAVVAADRADGTMTRLITAWREAAAQTRAHRDFNGQDAMAKTAIAVTLEACAEQAEWVLNGETPNTAQAGERS